MTLLTPDGRAVTHRLDTCVALEIDSYGDLYDAFDYALRGDGADVEGRRVRMQGSL
jgi:hypothetical protein